MRLVGDSPATDIRVDLDRVPMIGEEVEIGNSSEGGESYLVTNVITYTHDSEHYVILHKPRY